MRIRTSTIVERMTMLPATVMRVFYGDERRTLALGRPFYVSLRDSIVSRVILAEGVWEPSETALAQRLTRPGDHVVDVGANIGYYSVIYGSQTGSGGKVLAIEPDPENAKLLRKNLDINGLTQIVRVAEAAAGSQGGEITLYLNKSNRGDHRTYETLDLDMFNQAHARATVRVATSAVDDLVADWERVDLIKMDIQGFEPQALGGMTQTLARNEDVILITEFWPHGLRLAGYSGEGYLETLRSFGFSLFEILENGSLKAVEPAELSARVTGEFHVDLVCARPQASRARLQAFM